MGGGCCCCMRGVCPICGSSNKCEPSLDVYTAYAPVVTGGCSIPVVIGACSVVHSPSLPCVCAWGCMYMWM